ncbi:MAG: nucleotide sugar dehydrogenase [Candidatus Magnetoovum sp. WYHC-5]|nr:nucleotide sugar dehydrogenase [Candidatus Magnetoovum sp. WYHC-5]
MSNYLYDVCIVGGLGHIGLPMGISLAKEGKRVILYDINKEAANIVSGGDVPFTEHGAKEVLQEVLFKNLFISADENSISQSFYIIVVIGTPVDEHLNPQFTIFKKFFLNILKYLNDGQHIILRSTVFPGTTDKVRDMLLRHGKAVRVTFCPERIAEGKAMEELRSLPQIIGATDDISFEEAKGLFSCLTSDLLRLTPLEAELTKLFTNVWRYIQFAISNQFYQIAVEHGIDFYKIYDAATYNYPRTKGFPKAGFAAGPCLFKDTMQLASFSNNSFFLGHSAMLINEGLPNFIVKRLKERYPLSERVVGILGMAFKGDVDDSRESLSYKLKKILQIEAKEVLCTDPYVKDSSLINLDETISRADILIIGATHSIYKDLGLDTSDKVVIDVWNFFQKGGFF